MADHTRHQKKIIERYYDRRDEIMLGKLGELVTDLDLAETDRRRDQLWKRVDQAMKQLKVRPGLVEHILTARDEAVLARNLKIWLKQARS